MGLVINDSLNLGPHTTFINKNIRETVYKFVLLNKIILHNTLLIIFIAVIESILIYGIFLRGKSHKNSPKILNITHGMIIKITMYMPTDYSTTGVKSNDYILEIPKMIHKFLAYINIISYSHNIRLVTTGALLVPKKRIESCHRHIAFIGLMLYNRLPNRFINLKITNYNRVIKDWTLVNFKQIPDLMSHWL